MNIIKTALKTIFLNIDEELLMIGKIKTEEEEENSKVKLLFAIIASLALISF